MCAPFLIKKCAVVRAESMCPTFFTLQSQNYDGAGVPSFPGQLHYCDIYGLTITYQAKALCECKQLEYICTIW